MKPLFEGNFSLLTKSCTQTILFFCRFLSLCRFLCKAMLTKFCEPQSHRLIAMPASNSWESRIQSSQILTRNSRVSKSNTRSLGRCLLWKHVDITYFYIFLLFCRTFFTFEPGHRSKRNRSTQLKPDRRPTDASDAHSPGHCDAGCWAEG